MKTSKTPQKFGSFVEMLTVLPDDNACRLFLEDLRWMVNLFALIVVQSGKAIMN